MMSIFKLKRNTNYIFTFGSLGSGKSTLMASIAKYFSIITKIQTNQKNKDGNQVIFDWITDLDDYKFPEKSRVGDIFEIDLAVGKDDVYQLTFLEMAGEDLENVDVRRNRSGELHEKFVAFAKQTKIFLLITDVQHARNDDLLICQFFNYVKEKNADISKVGLIICKWDTNTTGFEKEEFVREHMPQTIHWLDSSDVEDAQIFTFSIGEVDNNSLVKISFNDTKKIAKWLIELLD